MMSSLVQLILVLAFCLSLHLSCSTGLSFTKKPPSQLLASLGSDAIFRWEFTFGDVGDLNASISVVWGNAYNYGFFRNKFITVTPPRKWEVNTKQVSSSITSRLHWSGNFNKNESLQVFTLRNVSKSDKDFFVCKVFNRWSGSELKSDLVELLVRVPPRIITKPNERVDVEDGDTVSLECDAVGDPPLSITWQNNGKVLKRGNTSIVLQIPNVRLKDGGTFTCNATNQAGFDFHRVKLRVVRYRPHINKTASTSPFTKSWLDHNSTLHCAFYANPVANLTWFKDGRQILEGVHSTHDGSTLTLTPKTLGDFGLYSCNATNKKGTTWYHITVEQLHSPGPPKVHKISPNVLELNVTWNTSIENGGSDILDFMITLLHVNGSIVKSQNAIKETSFDLKHLSQNRTYIVMLQARNIVGYGESENITVTTLVADLPGPPVIEALRAGVLSLNISWYSPIKHNSIEVFDYRIQVLDGITQKLIKQYASIPATSLVIKNLKKNSSYTIEIEGRNEVGYGEAAKFIGITLPQGPPDSPSISSPTVNGNNCSLQWLEPYDGKSPITMYTLYVWKINFSSDDSLSLKIFKTFNTTETFSAKLNLEWNQNYTVAVSAWNKYGEGSSSSRELCQIGRNPQVTTTTTIPSTANTFTTIRTQDTEAASPAGTTGASTMTSTTESEDTMETNNTAVEDNSIKFDHLLLIWIAILAVIVAGFLLLLWKATQKIRKCRYQRKTNHLKERELGNASTISSSEELKEIPVRNQYESIEILEVHYNGGYSSEESKNVEESVPVTHHYHVARGLSEYNHLHETSGSPRSKQSKNTRNKQRQEIGEYSHLSRGESLDKERNRSQLPNVSFMVPSRRHWEISRDRLRIESTIGRGEFGLVKIGYALDVTNDGGWSVVAIKTLKDNASESHLKDLLSELKVMEELSPHKHVVQLLACITKSEPLCVITEFAPYGDLLGFLRKKRGFKDDYYSIQQLPSIRLTSRQLMTFAWQIADGMAHLSAAKIIHRDLAARNVLLGENLTCKVTDFGMARNIHERGMYQKSSEGRLPVKWTALEALEHGQYTTKSDVWSFGVLVFEIVTIGGRPYPGMDAAELVEKLRRGYRIEKPQHLDEKVYDLMLSCWNEDPEKRLTFGQLYRALKQLDEEMEDCVNLTTYNGRVYENV
ncbi:uncharacterized protein LOC111329763 isoform X1 [Stylophora pistillata]|nr:uncharacterized protein LOC111329763 isoform X1 [Stylophora pistillata]XP_022790269.1 uncharacterized protein LOC111329763 isoform X1 [Stylophora pistillata]